MNYFCAFRRDLRQQRHDAIVTLKKHIAQLKGSELKRPSPNELTSVAAALGLTVTDVSVLTMSFFSELYERDLNDKHAFWEMRRVQLQKEWIQTQDVFAEPLTNALSALQQTLPNPATDVAARQIHSPFLLNDVDIDAALRQQDAQDHVWLNETKEARRDRHQNMTYAQLVAEKNQCEARLSALYQAAQDEYRADFQVFNDRWLPWVRTEKRLEWLEQLRLEELDRYYDQECDRVQQQYRLLKTALKDKSKDDDLKSRQQQPKYVRVMCRVREGTKNALVKVNYNQTVGQFAQSIVHDQFHLAVAPHQSIWVFIVSGPKMQERLVLDHYDFSKIASLNVVITS